MYSDNFLNFQNHTHHFVIDSKVFLRYEKFIENELDAIQNAVPKPFSLEKVLIDCVNQQMGKSVHILAGGGLDSNVLIAILDKLKATDVTVWTYLNSSNASEVNNLKRLCKDIGFQHFIYRAEDLNFDKELSEFQNKYNRYPNDIAMPIVGALARLAVKRSGENFVLIDGQYADTYLFANPQNKYFWLTQGLSWFQSITFYSKIQRLTNRTLSHLLFAFSCTEIKILYLSRIKICTESVGIVRKLCQNSELSKEVLLQVIFKFVLLSQREADKYKLHSAILSPFKSDELFIQSALNRINSTEIPNKYIVYQIMKSLKPSFVLRTKSRSFKL